MGPTIDRAMNRVLLALCIRDMRIRSYGRTEVVKTSRPSETFRRAALGTFKVALLFRAEETWRVACGIPELNPHFATTLLALTHSKG